MTPTNDRDSGQLSDGLEPAAHVEILEQERVIRYLVERRRLKTGHMR